MMSTTLLALAQSFSNERLTAIEFSNAYMELWKFERDNGLLQKDPDNLDSCLLKFFCLADLFYPDDRERYELDEDQLRAKVIETIKEFGVD